MARRRRRRCQRCWPSCSRRCPLARTHRRDCWGSSTRQHSPGHSASASSNVCAADDPPRWGGHHPCSRCRRVGQRSTGFEQSTARQMLPAWPPVKPAGRSLDLLPSPLHPSSPMMALPGGQHVPLPSSHGSLGGTADAAAAPSSWVCPRPPAQGQTQNNPTALAAAAAFQGKNASTISPPTVALAQPGGPAQLALWPPTSCPCPYAGCTHGEVEFTCSRAAAAQPLPAPSAEQEAVLHLAQQSAHQTSSASLWHQRPSAPSRVTAFPSLAPTTSEHPRLSTGTSLAGAAPPPPILQQKRLRPEESSQEENSSQAPLRPKKKPRQSHQRWDRKDQDENLRRIALEALVAQRKAAGQQTSPFAGVRWSAKARRWEARIWEGKRQQTIGYYTDGKCSSSAPFAVCLFRSLLLIKEVLHRGDCSSSRRRGDAADTRRAGAAAQADPASRPAADSFEPAPLFGAGPGDRRHGS
eukprot:COSAG04_NODE_3295_length_2963_cov_1.327514_5_plen_468_part_00